MSYKIDWVNHNPYITFKGDLSFGSIAKVNEFIIDYEGFDQMKCQTWDFTEAKKVKPSDFTEAKARSMATFDKSAYVWNKDMKVALITDDDIFRHFCEIYAQSMKDTKWSVKIFENSKKAKEWCKD